MKIHKIAYLSVIALVFSMAIFSNAFADNTDVVDQINITVPVSCTMSGTGMNSHTEEIANGTYESEIGTTTLTAFCNDNNGFSIYAAGYTGNEIGGTNSNKLVGTSASGNATIITGTATTAGTPDVSNWAMKLAITQDSGDTTGTNAIAIDNSFNNYHTVPNEYTKVAHKNSATNMDTTTGGVKLTTTYAAYISKTQPADTYTGQVIYTLIHPSYANAEGCNPNGNTISDILCMQDISSTNKSTVMASMTPEQQYILKDKRDGKEYTVAKLADGKVWMTQNLDLDLDSGTTYTNLDTDLGWDSQTNSYQTASWTPTRSTYTTTANNIHAWCQGGTFINGYCNGNNTPESYDPGDLYWNMATSNRTNWDAYYNSCDLSTSTPSCNESLNPLSTYVSVTGAAQYHLGNYYNWAAAIASNDDSIYGVYNGTTGKYENRETNQSICPAGWTLPYATSSNNPRQSIGDFASLWSEYGWTENDGLNDYSTLWLAPLYYTPAGYFDGYLNLVGYSDAIWSSVADGSITARDASFGTGGVGDPAGGEYRYRGNSIRCLLR